MESPKDINKMKIEGMINKNFDKIPLESKKYPLSNKTPGVDSKATFRNQLKMDTSYEVNVKLD